MHTHGESGCFHLSEMAFHRHASVKSVALYEMNARAQVAVDTFGLSVEMSLFPSYFRKWAS